MTTPWTYEKIIEELGYFKFKRNSISYEYLIEAISLVCEDYSYIKNFNKLYRLIAMKYGTESRRVFECIKKLLNVMYLNTEDSVIIDYFKLHYRSEKPSAKAFITYIARKINYEYYEREVGDLATMIG